MSYASYPSTGLMNGTTAVTLVAAPASGNKRIIASLLVYNADTANVTVIFNKVISSTNYPIGKATITPNVSFYLPAPVVLDNTMSLTAVLSAAITTTQPTFDVAYTEITP